MKSLGNEKAKELEKNHNIGIGWKKTVKSYDQRKWNEIHDLKENGIKNI